MYQPNQDHGYGYQHSGYSKFTNAFVFHNTIHLIKNAPGIGYPGHKNTVKPIFFHPDCTVGIGIAPIQLALADFYRRSGIAPCPEDLYEIINSIPRLHRLVKKTGLCYNKIT